MFIGNEFVSWFMRQLQLQLFPARIISIFENTQNMPRARLSMVRKVSLKGPGRPKQRLDPQLTVQKGKAEHREL